jgi:hypothetical protein
MKGENFSSASCFEKPGKRYKERVLMEVESPCSYLRGTQKNYRVVKGRAGSCGETSLPG